MKYVWSLFFHYVTDDVLDRITEWLAQNTVRYVACAEHENHINLTKKHLQVAVELTSKWSKSNSNYWTTGAGAKYLVPAVIPDSGSKKPKRWSQKQWHTGYDDAVLYVLKDGATSTYIRTSDDLAVHPLFGRWYEVHPRQEQRELPHKSKSFQQRMLMYWHEHECPRTERACFELMCDFISDEKWNYIDERSILRAARWLYSNANRKVWKDAMLQRYDNGQILL